MYKIRVILITLLPIATLSKLEALRVSNEGVIGNLHSQISGLQQKVGQLEGEREALQSSQRTSGEQLSTRIRVLEKVRVWGGGRGGVGRREGGECGGVGRREMGESLGA